MIKSTIGEFANSCKINFNQFIHMKIHLVSIQHYKTLCAIGTTLLACQFFSTEALAAAGKSGGTIVENIGSDVRGMLTGPMVTAAVQAGIGLGSGYLAILQRGFTPLVVGGVGMAGYQLLINQVAF